MIDVLNAGPEFLYSNLATDLIHEYRTRHPSVFIAILNSKRNASLHFDSSKEGRSKGGSLTAADIFPGTQDPSWCLENLSKWCQSQPFARMALVGSDSSAVTPQGI